jgi:hypothetical protein
MENSMANLKKARSFKIRGNRKEKPVHTDLSGETLKRIWQKALKLWSSYVRLQHPVFCIKKIEERKEGLTGSFAMIRLSDLRVIISLRQIKSYGLEDLLLEVLAHEIGHHVYCPADLTDLARMLARIRRGLPTFEDQADFIGNLYTDLMINNRLFREYNLPMDRLYKKVNKPTDNPLWNFYMRTCEILWSLPSKTLTSIEIGDTMEADAMLANRIIRNYARDWLRGAGYFAALCLTYLATDPDSRHQSGISIWLDTRDAARGTEMPTGLSSMDDDELTGSIHPATLEYGSLPVDEDSKRGAPAGNFREPFEYMEVLKGMGLQLSDAEIIAQYYKERALPYLIPFPVKEQPLSVEPLPEGLEPWDAGDPFEEINWLETVVRSPAVVPGLTTVKRIYGDTAGTEKKIEPIDLDLYLDCSGSMPNPMRHISYLTLAGAIISLSALRSGSSVQATLWSGTHQFIKTRGFVRDQKEIMAILTGYFGGSTAFPLHVFRDTYRDRLENTRKVHILVISDMGINSLFQVDEFGTSGEELTRMALDKSGGGATFVLNLDSDQWLQNSDIVKLRNMGIDIIRIQTWSDLVAFSKEFAKKKYGGTS